MASIPIRDWAKLTPAERDMVIGYINKLRIGENGTPHGGVSLRLIAIPRVHRISATDEAETKPHIFTAALEHRRNKYIALQATASFGFISIIILAIIRMIQLFR